MTTFYSEQRHVPMENRTRVRYIYIQHTIIIMVGGERERTKKKLHSSSHYTLQLSDKLLPIPPGSVIFLEKVSCGSYTITDRALDLGLMSALFFT